MSRYYLVGFVALLTLSCQIASAADDPIFSGPQVGEMIPPLKAKGVFGDLADNEIDIIKRGDSGPVALIFVHGRTRPAFGLTNSIMKWAVSRDGLQCAVVFLTDDATATSDWMRRIKSYFPEGVTHAVSVDGAEGPGSFGLNRNVTLTVLVGNQGKVSANLALVQPSLPADGPKILKAIVDVTGGGKVPTIAEIGGGRYAPDAARNMRAMQLNDPKLTSLLRAVINKQATKDEVTEAVAAVEKYVADRTAARRQIGQIAGRIVNSDKLSNYGTEAAQQTLREWAKKYGESRKARKDDSKP
jgi:hypothetical protein